MIGGDILFVRAPRACDSIGGNRLCVRSPACACAGARGRADTQPVNSNGITGTRSTDKQQSNTKHIALPILQVSSLISDEVFNTDARRQWRYTS